MSLALRLNTEDVPALIDKREGQKQEYRFIPEVKAELIQQFVLGIVPDGRASGKLLAEHLRERCELVLCERSIRDQLVKLGLSRIKKSLPERLPYVSASYPIRNTTDSVLSVHCGYRLPGTLYVPLQGRTTQPSALK